MAAATITFNVPVGLAILPKEDHPYLALGAMCGILAIPFGILITCLILMATEPSIRTAFTTTGPSEYKLNLTFSVIFINLLPIAAICGALALLLKFKPAGVIKGFMIYGKVLLSVLTLIAAGSIIEYYTGFFSKIFGHWGFDPVMADGEESFRAIEAVGAIAMMLTGAFPFIYLIRKFLGSYLVKAGRLAGLDEAGSAGALAAMANVMAMLAMIKEMKPPSKVLCLAFMVCGGYCLGDWIAFFVNFQPNLIVPVFIGQISGGLTGILFAHWLVLPRIKNPEEKQA
jgi:ethanolamine transporter